MVTSEMVVERVALAIAELEKWEGSTAELEEIREDYRKEARAAIEAHEAALADAGLVIVPREPKDVALRAMWIAHPMLGMQPWNNANQSCARAMYKATIDAFKS